MGCAEVDDEDDEGNSGDSDDAADITECVSAFGVFYVAMLFPPFPFFSRLASNNIGQMNASTMCWNLKTYEVSLGEQRLFMLFSHSFHSLALVCWSESDRSGSRRGAFAYSVFM